MKRYVTLSLMTAFILSGLSADNIEKLPLAKTFPVDVDAQKAPKTNNSDLKEEPLKVTVVKVKPKDKQDVRIDKLEKSLKKLKKKLSAIKKHDAKDNIKFSVDFRTSIDSIEYKSANGLTHKNDSLFSNRLWLNMAYAPSDDMIFKGQLSYNKAYGAAPKGERGIGQRGSSHNFDVFDWVSNENLTNDSIKLKEAYWLYKTDSLFGSKVSWTASFGRRPSTNGFLVSLRDDDKPASPMGHMINMEFDGASFKFGLEKVTGVSGMFWKLCLGRGLTNARARFNVDTGLASSGDYSEDTENLDNVDLAGFIFVPYDDGQYKIMTTYYRGLNVPGFTMADPAMMNPASENEGMLAFIDANGNGVADGIVLNEQVNLRNMGDMDGAAVSLLVDGIGDGINDFLDSTKFFASFGWSKSMPDNSRKTFDMFTMNKQITAGVQQALGALGHQPTQEDIKVAQQQVIEGMLTQLASNPQAAANFLIDDGMMGSTDDETGTSYWIGLQLPALFSDDGIIGLEYNHGSKYWRPFTYGEDTLVGSKLATRGDAYEVYYSQPLTKAFSMQLRYTKINYDYTGSQGFFGASGTPMTMSEAKAFGMDPVEEAEDIRLSFRYRF